VYLLKPEASNFKVVYSGAIDDNPQVPADVSQQYLKNAINGLLTGKPSQTASERPTGCMIKKQ
jgi:hypothetical protein